MFGFSKGATEGKVVETPCGPIIGIVSKSRDGRDFYEWRGIPYAKPPIGPLRFASPQPFGKWDGVRDGTKFGPRCPEVSRLYAAPAGDEDCLNLNVAVPKVESTELLPVMVFIHGGAFQSGSGSMYHPDFFMDEDVILVTPNYRLGVFGFLNTGDSSIRGNMGLKDQRLALRWVKENIQSFGGNPNQITIFGESAGGASIHHLLLSPSTKGLFNKAISQSGVASPYWACELTEESVAFTRSFAKRLGCDTEDSEKIVECLRGKTVTELLDAYLPEMGPTFRPDKDTHVFVPSIEAIDDEEAFLVEHPLEILAKGKAQRVPWMIGVNSDEGLLTSIAFYSSDQVMHSYEKVMDKRILRAFGIKHEVPNKAELSLKVKEIYFPNDSSFTKEEKLQQFTKLFSDAGFNLYSSHAISIQRQFSPVYPYYYSRRGGPSLTTLLTMLTSQGSLAKKLLVFGFWSLYNKITGSKPMDYGVCHSDELAMQFRVDRLYNVTKDPNSADYKFSKEMTKLWVDYARDDTMLEFKGVRFPAQEPEKPMQYFEICETPKLIDEPFAERTDALKSLGLIELRVPKPK